MRSIYSILLLAFALHVFTQTPQGFNYSAVARDASGKPIASKNIAVQMSILKTSSSGILQYAETHLVNTDAYGLFNLIVGNGSVVTGTLTNIQWGTDKHFLKVALDPNGGNNFAVMGTTQLMSVPYAMHAVNGLQSGTTTGEILYWNGTNWLPITPGNQSQTLTFCDGKPTWTTAGQCPGTLAALNCGNATNNGNLISGSPANSVSSTIPYTGGNGGPYAAQSISSSGVTGLNASLGAGNFANGSGNLTLNISGTPTNTGTATFALSIGGQSCVLTLTVSINLVAQYPSGSVFCNSSPTAIIDVTNPVTGKIWMDRNLGASQKATSSTDANSYGDLYQWGRRADGHQCRNSATTSTLSSTDQPGHGAFIITSNISPNDWRSPQNINLWQGVNGINNPCPIGYKLPTNIELGDEINSWNNSNSAGAFASVLKFTLAGNRGAPTGAVANGGFSGNYWTSSVFSTWSSHLVFNTTGANIQNSNRAMGLSVRCIKD